MFNSYWGDVNGRIEGVTQVVTNFLSFILVQKKLKIRGSTQNHHKSWLELQGRVSSLTNNPK
jgi:hypothetical protein